jgi:hypothetical protein
MQRLMNGEGQVQWVGIHHLASAQADKGIIMAGASVIRSKPIWCLLITTIYQSLSHSGTVHED